MSASYRDPGSREGLDLTIRVGDVPPATDQGVLKCNISSLVESDEILKLNVSSIEPRSLALDPNGHSATATVVFTTSLSTDVLTAQLRKAIGLASMPRYLFSCTFHGLTPLYTSDEDAHVDIIAVTGLGGHALGSWRSKDDNDVWLRDYLPSDIPNIRVVVYGYDTKLVGSESKQSIEDLGNDFLNQLIAYRAQGNVEHRPLIFIGHSLGGLVVKQALIRAHTRRHRPDVNLANACIGLLLYGVPNHGLRHEELNAMVKGQPNEEMLHDLIADHHSEARSYLRVLRQQFNDYCQSRYTVVTFFERELSATVHQNENFAWVRKGPKRLLVTRESACQTGLGGQPDDIGCTTDHSGLVKYSKGSGVNYSIYQVTCERIKRLISSLHQGDFDNTGELCKLAAVCLDIRHHFSTILHHKDHCAEGLTDRDCLRSLAFPDMHSRKENIEHATNHTCEWLFEHSCWKAWRMQHWGLLWIQGNPGSGKSTLMEYATGHYVGDQEVQKPLIVSFFFHARGNELQKSLPGFFRSVLHQLLLNVPSAMSHVTRYFKEQKESMGEDGSNWGWHEKVMKDLLSQSLEKVLNITPVTFFFDALDECDQGSAPYLVGYFRTIMLHHRPTKHKLNICFSCRYYPVQAVGTDLTIHADRENREDIATFVRAKLPNDLYARIGNLLTNRAGGIFMWARLVVDHVLRLDKKGQSIPRIKAAIEKTPGQLSDLYKELMQQLAVDEDDRDDSLILFQWVAFSMEPLKRHWLHWAMAVTANRSLMSLDEYESTDSIVSLERLDRRVTSLSCGLIEIVDSGRTINSGRTLVVQFIHQSVGEYVRSEGLAALGCAPEARAEAHSRIALACLHAVRLFPSSPTPPSRFGVPWFILHYVSDYLPDHIRRGYQTRSNSENIMDIIGRSPADFLSQWAKLEHVVQFTYSTRYKDIEAGGFTLTHFLAYYNCSWLLRQLLANNGTSDPYGIRRNIDVATARFETPLYIAADKGWTETVQILLDSGEVNPDTEARSGWTALWAAIWGGHAEVVKLLLYTGKVDFKTRVDGQTPLSCAKRRGFRQVEQMLREAGAVESSTASRLSDRVDHSSIKSISDTSDETD